MGDQSRGLLFLHLIGKVQLLEKKLVVSSGEGEVVEGDDVVGRVGVLLVEATQQGEHQRALRDGLANVTKGIDRGLQEKIVVIDGIVSLRQ